MKTEERKGSSKTILILAIIIIFINILGLGLFFRFSMNKKNESATDKKDTNFIAVNSSAAKKLANGLILDVLEAKKMPDGLIELHWRYQNPTSETINLCSTDGGKILRDGIYCEYAEKKYYPFIHNQNKLISEIGWVDVQPGKSRDFWSRFEIPITENDASVSLFVPGLSLPFDDVKVDFKKKQTTQKENFTAHHSSGLTVKVSRVKQLSPDLIEIRWVYFNPTKENILLCSTDYAAQLPTLIFLELDSSKNIQPVCKDPQGIFSASQLPYTTITPGESIEVFAKFAINVNPEDSLTLYLPDTTPLSHLKTGMSR